MIQTVKAIYERGILRLLNPLQGVRENEQVRVTVVHSESQRSGLAACFGVISAEDGREMERIVREEFERVDPREWE